MILLLGVVMTFPPAINAATPAIGAFSDTFNSAHNAEPHYGLNDSLLGRQTNVVRGVTYTRVPGLATGGDISGNPLQPWHSQVNHPTQPNKLAFYLRTSADRLDAPIVNNGSLQVSAKLTPVVGSNTRTEFSSIVLGNTTASYGYPTNADATAMLIRSNGKLEIWQYGKAIYSKVLSPKPADGVYNTTFRIDGNVNVTVTINGQVSTVKLPKAVPSRPYLYLGRYSADTNIVSTVDDLTVSSVDSTALRVPATSGLKYFGYFGARIESVPDNHVPYVSGFSNLNWVSISDLGGYQTDELQACAPGTCVLNTRWQFFQDCPGENCRLRDDAQAVWDDFAMQIMPYKDKIGAFALMDEAYWQGASYEDVASSAAMIKQTFPDKPVMLNFAAPTVQPDTQIPPQVDWVAFDQYCEPMTTVENTLRTLETATASRPDVKLFIYTESARNLCGTTKTDAAVAQQQWDYYNLAVRHPRVAGILPFGLWTYETSLSPLPATINAQQGIAARILKQSL